MKYPFSGVCEAKYWLEKTSEVPKMYYEGENFCS